MLLTKNVSSRFLLKWVKFLVKQYYDICYSYCHHVFTFCFHLYYIKIVQKVYYGIKFSDVSEDREMKILVITYVRRNLLFYAFTTFSPLEGLHQATAPKSKMEPYVDIYSFYRPWRKISVQTRGTVNRSRLITKINNQCQSWKIVLFYIIGCSK